MPYEWAVWFGIGLLIGLGMGALGTIAYIREKKL